MVLIRQNNVWVLVSTAEAAKILGKSKRSTLLNDTDY